MGATVSAEQAKLVEIISDVCFSRRLSSKPEILLLLRDYSVRESGPTPHMHLRQNRPRSISSTPSTLLQRDGKECICVYIYMYTHIHPYICSAPLRDRTPPILMHPCSEDHCFAAYTENLVGIVVSRSPAKG